ESASSSRLSTMPSTMSFSAGVGTYCVQKRSPGLPICASTAGVSRMLKRSTARCTAARSMCSAPNRWTSSSTVVTLCFRMSCHLSMLTRQDLRLDAFGEDDPIVTLGVEVGHSCYLRVAAAHVERARRFVERLRGGFDDHESCIRPGKPSLHLLKQDRPGPCVLRALRHGDPVQIVRAGRAGREAIADVADQVAAGGEGAQGGIVLIGLVEVGIENF